jgi:hypothetical protein
MFAKLGSRASYQAITSRLCARLLISARTAATWPVGAATVADFQPA